MAKTPCLKTVGCLENENKTKEWPFIMIHSNIERRLLETIDVFVCQIEAKQTSLIIEFICEYLIFDSLDLSHLKRVRKVDKNNGQTKLDVILHSTKDLSLEDLKRKLKEQLIDVDVRIIHVSKYPPLTRTQFYEWSTLWPLHFRTGMKKQVKFTDESLLKLKTLMNYVWSLANENKEMKIATIIVDLGFNIVSECRDSRLSSNNPLRHSVINCITEINQKCKTKGMLTFLICFPFTNFGTENISYLCKDLIFITTHEPCVMCCMALVHSRVFRIFYSITMPKTGGLESNYHIHGRNELNHRYQAFGGFTVENTLNTIDDFVHT
ncbi:hypothetical protein PMAC_000178 [Pneumocystis sp. 'macacae']|nr:hypothetical protein PMAC_000178 [Pneumocystis sp. 'macacae']